MRTSLAALLACALLQACSDEAPEAPTPTPPPNPLQLGSELPEAPPAPSAAEARVRVAYNDYRRALLSGQGAVAAACLSTETLALYDRLVDRILHDEREQLADMSLVEKKLLLEARLRIPVEVLRGLDGAGYFAFTVVEGWAVDDDVRFSDVGLIEIEGDQAWGQHRVQGQPTGASLHFVLEDGQWRFDQRQTFEAADRSLRDYAQNSGIDPDRFLISLMEQSGEVRVPRQVWDPMVSD